MNYIMVHSSLLWYQTYILKKNYDLQTSKNLISRLLYDLLTISCYVGALLAIQTGYDVIVSYLLELTIRRLQADKTTSVPLKVSDVIQEFRAWNDLKDSR